MKCYGFDRKDKLCCCNGANCCRLNKNYTNSTPITGRHARRRRSRSRARQQARAEILQSID